MPHIIVLKAFKFAHFGYQVEEFEPNSQPRETTEECAAIAIREKWAKSTKATPDAATTDAADGGGKGADSPA